MKYLVTGSALTPFECDTLREAIKAAEEYSLYGHKGMKIWYDSPEKVMLETDSSGAFAASAPRERASGERSDAKESFLAGGRPTAFHEAGAFVLANELPAAPVPPSSDTAVLSPELGRKFDSEKLRFSLIPVEVLQEVIEVLEFGAKKYAPDNWKFVMGAEQRYLDATFRHLFLDRNHELRDKETKKLHVAHAICCLLFLGWFDLQSELKATSEENL